MSENENNSSIKKVPPMRDPSLVGEGKGRSAKKARSYREETYKPADPNKPQPKTIILDDSAFIPRPSMRERAQQDMSRRRDLKVASSLRQVETADAMTDYDTDFENDILEDEDEFDSKPSRKGKSKGFSPISKIKEKFASVGTSGSSYKRDQEKKALLNGYIKKGAIALAALIVVIVIIVLLSGGSSMKPVGPITIESTATTQTLTWSGAKKSSSYEVYQAAGATAEYRLIDTLTEGENSKTYDGLTSGTMYRYEIVTVNKKGDKSEGTMAEAYTKPNAVTGTTAATMSENSLTVTWGLQGNTEVYELQYGMYDNLRDATTLTLHPSDVTDNGNDSYSYTINNLEVGQKYYISMRTVCGENASEWSSVIEGTVTDAVNMGTVDADKPMIALTFDGGPDGGDVTSRILDALSANNSHATFFQTGANAENYPELMKRIASEGNEVANHTYDETKVGGELTADDISMANNAIAAACGVTPTLFRAPQGEVTDAINNSCRDLGMSIVLWNFDSHDWEFYDAYSIVERVQAYAEDGDIIQFRNVYDETAEAMEELIPYFIEEGYQLVTVSQLIQAKTGNSPEPGKIYYSGYESE